MFSLVAGALGAGLLIAGVAVTRRRRLLGLPITALGLLVLLGAVLILVFVRAYRLRSASMVPTLRPGDRVAVLEGEVARGDIAVFDAPAGAATGECGARIKASALCPRSAGGRDDVRLIARVVALGGDRIALRDGRVIRNDRPADEPYARPCRPGERCDYPRAIEIPRGELYLLGDNRGAARDSRIYGPVPEDWVIGPVLLRYWPPSRWGRP